MSHKQTQSADVVIVGGGVAGVSAARKLSPDHDVVLIEKGQIAGEASGLSAGSIGVQSSYPDHPKIGEHAAEFFESYNGTGQFSYERRGYCKLVPHGSEAKARKMVEQSGPGYAGEYHPAAELEGRFPLIKTGDFAGAIVTPRQAGNGWLDPFTFCTTMLHDAEESGATVLTETPVVDLLVNDDQVRGVETPDTVYHAPSVVVAAGWWTPRFLQEYIELPVRPYRTQCIVLEPEKDFSGAPRGSLSEEHIYWRPEKNGDLLVGGWSFPVEEPEQANRAADESFREHVAKIIPEVFNGVEEAGIVNGWAGVDAATPDTYPIIDAPAAAPEGLVTATGFHGRGVMTAPVTATTIRSLVTGEELPFSRDPFRLDRFSSTSPDFEFDSIASE